MAASAASGSSSSSSSSINDPMTASEASQPGRPSVRTTAANSSDYDSDGSGATSDGSGLFVLEMLDPNGGDGVTRSRGASSTSMGRRSDEASDEDAHSDGGGRRAGKQHQVRRHRPAASELSISSVGAYFTHSRSSSVAGGVGGHSRTASYASNGRSGGRGPLFEDGIPVREACILDLPDEVMVLICTLTAPEPLSGVDAYSDDAPFLERRRFSKNISMSPPPTREAAASTPPGVGTSQSLPVIMATDADGVATRAGTSAGGVSSGGGGGGPLEVLAPTTASGCAVEHRQRSHSVGEAERLRLMRPILSASDVLALAATCRVFAFLANDAMVWRRFYEMEYGPITASRRDWYGRSFHDSLELLLSQRRSPRGEAGLKRSFTPPGMDTIIVGGESTDAAAGSLENVAAVEDPPPMPVNYAHEWHWRPYAVERSFVQINKTLNAVPDSKIPLALTYLYECGLIDVPGDALPNETDAERVDWWLGAVVDAEVCADDDQCISSIIRWLFQCPLPLPLLWRFIFSSPRGCHILMAHFNFDGMTLEAALTYALSFFAFSDHARDIDRVAEAFAVRYLATQTTVECLVSEDDMYVIVFYMLMVASMADPEEATAERRRHKTLLLHALRRAPGNGGGGDGDEAVVGDGLPVPPNDAGADNLEEFIDGVFIDLGNSTRFWAARSFHDPAIMREAVRCPKRFRRDAKGFLELHRERLDYIDERGVVVERWLASARVSARPVKGGKTGCFEVTSARRGTVVFRVRDGASMAKWISLIREFLDISFVVNINRILIGSGEEGPGGTVVTGA